MEELAHIATFVRVVKTGSFAGAARELKIADSVASKHVAKLERALGVRLLNRTTRKLTLTEFGTAYHRHCVRIVDEIEKSRRTLATLQDEPRGLLRVTAPVPMATRLGPILRAFLERHPEVQIELDSSNRVVDLAAEGFDVALRFSRSLPPNVVARPLRIMHMKVCASPAYLRRNGTPKRPSDLARHDCLNLPAAVKDGIWHFRRGDERARIAVKGSVQSDAAEMLHELALSGAGITLMPGDLIAKDIRAGRLVPLLADWEVETGVQLYAVFLPARSIPPKIRAFVDHLVERFKQRMR